MVLSQMRKWIRLVFSKRPVRPSRRPGSSARLFLECLEGRALPSTVTWINPGGGDWDTASNWLDATSGTNHVPTANDDAVIATSGITVTHTSFFTSDTVNSLTSQATLSVSNGSLTFNTPSTTQALIMSGGTLTVASPDPSNPGSLEVATLTQSGGSIAGPGTVTVDTALLWTGGTMSGSGATEVQGSAEIGGGSPFGPTLNGRTLDNFGTTTVDSGSNLLFAGQASFNNQSGAQLVLQGTAGLGNFFGNSGTLNNAGTLTGSGTTGTTSTVDVAIDNTGAVDVQAGAALAAIAGGNSSGDFNLEGGSHLSIGGTFTLLDGATTEAGPGSQLELDGIVTQQGGAAVSLASGSILNVGPNFSFGGQNYSLADGAAVTGNGVVVLSGFSSQMTVNGAATIDNLAVSNGTVTINAADSLEIGTLTQTGGTITGPGAVTIDKLWDWTGGAMSGTGQTISNGTATLGNSPFGTTLDTRTVNNAGTAMLPDNDAIAFSNHAVWNNLAGSTLALGNNSSLGNFFGNSGTINNAGRLTRSGLNNTTSIVDVPLDNTGRVNVQAGTLNAAAGLTNEGTLVLSPGALATVTGGNSSGAIKLRAGSHLSIAGNFTLLAGSTTRAGLGSQLELDGIVTQQGGAAVTLASGSILNVGPSFSFGGQNYILADGAAVTGKGTVQLNGFSSLMTVTVAATVRNLALGNGTVTVNPSGSLDVRNLTQTGGTLTGPGTVTIDKLWDWTGGAMSGAGQTVNNGTATLGNSPFGTTLDTRTVNNAGNVTLPDNDAIAFKTNSVWNNLTGSTLVLGNNSSLGNFFGNSGTLNNAGLIADSGPTGQETIQLSLGVSNSGTISLQGVLNINGSYAQTAAGTLTIVFGTSTNGELKVTGQAMLNGTLNVNTPDGFSPTAGQAFTILTFSGVSGDFSTFTGLDLGNGLTLTPSHNSNTYTLTVTPS